MARGKHAAENRGNVVELVDRLRADESYFGEPLYDHDTGLLDDDDGLDEMPYLPEMSTFDIESGSHVAMQVPVDDTRFGRAWHDPEPDPEINLPHQYDDDGSGHYVPGEGRSRSVRRPVLAFVLVAILFSATVAFAGYGLEAWGGKRVPDVAGSSEGSARSAIEAKGLKASTELRPVDDGVGFVLETSPAAGMRVEPGTTVVVYVGVARVIPEVAGLAEGEARAALGKAGALEVKVTYEASDAPEGTVVAVTPGVGETFTSRDRVTLVIAQAHTVPDVVGASEAEAMAAVQAAGLTPVAVEVTVQGATVGTVASTDPAAGTKLEAGAEVRVNVVVGTPSSFANVAQYWGTSPRAIATYVSSQGFSLRSGWVNDVGEAQALYQSNDKGTLAFTSRPFSHAFDTSAGWSGNNVLAAGSKFVGVRWEVPAAMLPEGASQLTDEAADALAATCGLEGASDSCNQDNVLIPTGSHKSGARFICKYGELGGFAWTVLIANDGATRAVVTCAQKSLYDAYDLSPYDGRICCLVAYADMYTE